MQIEPGQAFDLRDREVDRAARVGASFIGTMSSVLLVPEPLTTEIPVTVQVTAPPGVDVAVGLAQGKSPQGYRLMAHEIPVATYFAFGKLEQRTLDIDGARIPAGIGNAAGLQNLVEAMRARGYGEPLIEKLCFRNWLRVLGRTWGSAPAR